MARYKEYGYDIKDGMGIIPEWEHSEMTTVEIADKVYNMMLEDLGEEYRPTVAQNT